MFDEEKKSKVVSLIQGATEPIEESVKPKRAPRSKPAQTAGNAVNISGSNNSIAQVGNGNTYNDHKTVIQTLKTTLEVAPPPGSIGANPLLRSRIDKLFKAINKFRAERLGDKYKYGALYGEMARHFGLKAKEWTDMWLWPESRADEVIHFLEDKRDNTQQGRVNKAASRPGYKHTRGHLFRLEKEALAKLEWDGNSDAVRELRYRLIGKSSRSDMSDNEFANWVAHLEGEVRRAHEE